MKVMMQLMVVLLDLKVRNSTNVWETVSFCSFICTMFVVKICLPHGKSCTCALPNAATKKLDMTENLKLVIPEGIGF